MNFTKSFITIIMLSLAVIVAADEEPQMHRRLVAVRLRGGAAALSNSVAQLDDLPSPR
jgi:uncharacterized protein (DUF1501 family)